jgi:small subunit ribosomal protein S3
MGQKIRPTSLRTGVSKNWKSRWFARGFDFAQNLEEDHIIRTTVMDMIVQAGIDSITIDRTANAYKITIKAAKPGLIIGRGGKGIEDLTAKIEKKLQSFRKRNNIQDRPALSINIEEIKRYDVSATVTAQQIAWDLEKRMPFRRVIKKQLQQLMQNRDVKGVKIRVAGRLNGAEIARAETVSEGSLPLQTLRADIDYGEVIAKTTYGTIGVKVWIYKGEIFGEHISGE